jgi:catechol 2,3-dioxygenase-like lactoylglutathione lyase family enzyme
MANEARPDCSAGSQDAGFPINIHAVDEPAPAAHVTVLVARNRELQAELDRVRADRNRLAETQTRVMELLHVSSPDKLLHDIRNVLNERELLKALVGDI